MLHTPVQIDDADVEEPEVLEDDRPRRRGRMLALVAAVGVASLAGAVWWNRAVTAPTGLRFTNIDVYRNAPGDTSGIRTLDNRLGREARIDFTRAGRFTVLLDLENTGRRPVHLKAIPRTTFYHWAIHTVSYSPADWWNGGDRAAVRYQPFRPLMLAPDDAIAVRFDFVFADCDLTKPTEATPWSPSAVERIPVTHQRLGFRRTKPVPLDDAILSVVVNGDCDNQILRP